MQRLWKFLSVVGCLALFGGCESLSDIREKFSTREQRRTHLYTADPRATYEAARKAADQMGYRFLRGGPAQGELEAISGVATSDTMNSSRQISMNVKLAATPEGGTEMSLLFREILEGDSARRAGQATATALRDTPQYEVFFRTVQQALDSPKKP
jgi:hypothetical protein